RLPVTQTEFRLIFHHPPRLGVVLRGRREPDADQLVVRLDPSAGLRIQLEARDQNSDEPETVFLDRELGREGRTAATPYEVLLHAAMVGNSTRFGRQDGVEQHWRIMAPLLAAPPPIQPYAPGTWGPAAAEWLLEGSGRWHEPWTET